MPASRIQPGVHFRKGENPPGMWRLVMLDFAATAGKADADLAVTLIWELMQNLTAGHVPELGQEHPDDPEFAVPTGRLTALLGYGSNLFSSRANGQKPLVPLVMRPRPLGARLRGGAGRPFPALEWDCDCTIASGQRDLCLQLTAETELALSRAILELHELIRTRNLPITLRNVFGGFHRDDRRSWIGFHDGINNLSPQERERSIPVRASSDDAWMAHGTYMVFIKIKVDLPVWRALARPVQEALVGRTKLGGTPLVSFDVQGGLVTPHPTAGCPFNPQGPGFRTTTPACFSHPDANRSGPITASHIIRSNLNGGAASVTSNNRIYRQGYEFLDLAPNAAPVVGLNFVAFVAHPDRVRNILDTNDWLGDVNFGGGAHGLPDVKFLSVLAAGVYAVPPVAQGADRYPGQSLFAAPVVA